MNYWIGYVLVLLLFNGGLTWFLLRCHRAGKLLLTNIALTVLTLFFTLMALEFYFKVFFAQTDTVPTLAQKNWYTRYYEGTFNSLGYRDTEWTEQMVAGKIKVMVVGDSFVEGVGIENPRDRFSDRLAQKLGPDYAVFNLGKAGANTEAEIKAVTEYPYRPDILILSYFVNDIEGGAAWQRGLTRPPSFEVPSYLVPFVKNSYAFNFFYWRLVRFWEAGQPDLKWQWFLSLYDNPEVWWLHQQELLSFYEGARAEQILLFVVVFPGLTHLEDSKVVTDRIVNLYRERGVPTLDVGDLVKDIPQNQLVASPVDSHPGERVHELVGQALYEMVIDPNYQKKQAGGS